jgi:hypothetical protein
MVVLQLHQGVEGLALEVTLAMTADLCSRQTAGKRVGICLTDVDSRAFVGCDKLKAMNTVFTSIEYEFTSVEQALAYDQWLREKVEASLVKADDPNAPRYSTDEVMWRMNAIVQAAKAKPAASRLA